MRIPSQRIFFEGVPPLKVSAVRVKQYAIFIYPPRWPVGEASLPATTQNHPHLAGGGC